METKKLEILVIEDGTKHLSNAQELLNERQELISADYASTLEDSLKMLEEKRYDGVLSDIFFPTRKGGEEEPNGEVIINYCMENKLPVTLITSTHHHGAKTEPIYKLCCRKRIEMIDAINHEEAEKNEKNWKYGITALAQDIIGIEKGLITFEESEDGRRYHHFSRPDFKEIMTKYRFK